VYYCGVDTSGNVNDDFQASNLDSHSLSRDYRLK
jgi:hypothetical protein